MGVAEAMKADMIDPSGISIGQVATLEHERARLLPGGLARFTGLEWEATMDYMTQSDKERLEQELKDRTRKRKELSDRIGRAREMGDLKENAEYHAAREDQGLNEARIHDLKEKLSNVVITDTEAVPDGMVFVGTTVKLKDLSSGSEEIYKLVGEMSGSFDLEVIEVTPNSTLGMGLMKAKVGETLSVDLPRGTKSYEIVEIL